MTILQKPLKFEVDMDFLELPTRKLLEAYGAGSHIPGSGSAAALSALFGIELLKTVCTLTCRKEAYRDVHSKLQYIQERLETEFKPNLTGLFRQDIESFNKVSKLRIQRDKTTDKKERSRLHKLSLEEQKRATEIPIQICDICLNLLPLAFAIFEEGFKAARGDTGVAISNLLSATSGGLFVIFLNLTSYRQSKWRDKTRRRAEELAAQLSQFQNKAYTKVLELYEERLEDSEKQLQFEFAQIIVSSEPKSGD
jgi:methenyltetrahydrofolate cyclohydrolase